MNSNLTQSCIAIGNFDGIHIAHDALIKEIIKISKKNNLKSIIITFKYVNINMKKSKSNIKYITTHEQKLKLLSKYNVDEIVTIELNHKISKYTPEQFIKEILIKKYNAKYIVVGYNFRFGYMAKGNIDTLLKYETIYNYKTKEIKPICFNNTPVSSSFIRNLIISGDIKTANKLLVNKYCIYYENIKVCHKNNNIACLSYDLNICVPKDGSYNVRVGNEFMILKIKHDNLFVFLNFRNYKIENKNIEFI